jgi:hypothetical protein
MHSELRQWNGGRLKKVESSARLAHKGRSRLNTDPHYHPHRGASWRKDVPMLVLVLAVIIGMPLLLSMSGAGVLVESITVDELKGMGVVRRY